MVTKLKAISWVIAIASFVGAAVCFSLGSSLSTNCGTVPCSIGEVIGAATRSVEALDYYILGVVVLVAGEAVVAILWLAMRPRSLSQA